MCWTNIDAGRLQADVNTMSTIVALGGRVRVRIQVQSVIRASLHASPAANAALVVKVNDSILTVKKGSDRADINTGGIRTVIAAHHREVPLRIGELALLNVLHPGAIDADGSVMFGFASYGAGMAADTFLVVYSHFIWTKHE